MPLIVLSILGTRPEAVKMSPVIREIRRHPDSIRGITCVTGQHQEMLSPILELFEITPDYHLDVMRPDQSLVALLARLLTELDRVVQRVQPDWILAQGDTTTVLAASLTAYYNRCAFGHVEAGLRTGNKYSPYPEEGNRILADAVADAYFTPTNTSRDNLLAENIPSDRIVVTGNTVVDALLDFASRPYTSDFLKSLPDNKRLILVTAHRRENFGEAFRELCYALRDIATRFDDVELFYPVHLNPNVQKPVYEILADVDRIHLIDPLPYPDLIHLMKRSTLILTDSGGIQEEAPTFNVPLLVIRDTTERPEGIEAGVAELVGTSRSCILNATERILTGEPDSQRTETINPYGDGKAAQRIVKHLLEAR